WPRSCPPRYSRRPTPTAGAFTVITAPSSSTAGCRRLAGQDARCRMVLGRLARAFLHVRGQQGLGFARLGDYARERLGMSARELQSLARVSARLEGLPEIRRAYENGEVSWLRSDCSSASRPRTR